MIVAMRLQCTKLLLCCYFLDPNLEVRERRLGYGVFDPTCSINSKNGFFILGTYCFKQRSTDFSLYANVTYTCYNDTNDLVSWNSMHPGLAS